MAERDIYTHCCYCRRKFDPAQRHLQKTTDHFYPKSRGGYNNTENKLPCCQECNGWKADRMPAAWLIVVEGYADRRWKKGTYTVRDLAQIVGSMRHWLTEKKDAPISTYRFKGST